MIGLVLLATLPWLQGTTRGSETAAAPTAPRADTVPFIRVPYRSLIPDHPEWEKADNASKHHQGLTAFAQHLAAGAQADLAAQAATVEQQVTGVADRIVQGVLTPALDLRKLAKGTG